MVIGAYKLITAGLAIALAFGLFRLFEADVRTTLEPIIRGLRLDPENTVVHAVIARLAPGSGAAALGRGGDTRVRRPPRGRGHRHPQGEAMGRGPDHHGHEFADPDRVLRDRQAAEPFEGRHAGHQYGHRRVPDHPDAAAFAARNGPPTTGSSRASEGGPRCRR